MDDAFVFRHWQGVNHMRSYLPILSARAMPMLAAALPALALGLMPAPAAAQISIGINFGGPQVDLGIRIGYAPPPMPVYVQPPLPAPDYIWVPGHWAWSDWIDDYYWVNGYWQQPPEPGLLWTPAWWGWENGAFGFHNGYWGREVGWYGGVDYGYGYRGHGWEGGYWQNGHLAYNGAIINVTNVHVTNVYYHPLPPHEGPRVSYNGGPGGVTERPTPQEIRATQAPHIPPTPAQRAHVEEAAKNPRAVASQMTPGWHPPAVHRVSADGKPIPREEALAKGGVTAGAPAGYHPPAVATGTGAGAGKMPARTMTPDVAHSGEHAMTPPAPHAAPPAHTAPAPTIYHAPAPTMYHAPAPAPHMAPPAPHMAPPAPHAAPPTPKPAPAPKPAPKPEPHEHEHDHQ